MNNNEANSKSFHQTKVRLMGKKHYTLQKMFEYGFWPAHLPTPYERAENQELEEEKLKVIQEMEKLSEEIAELYQTKKKINSELMELRNEIASFDDIQNVRKEIARRMMKESIERRRKRKEERKREKALKTKAWLKKKKEEIVFVGKGYSTFLYDTETDKAKLDSFNLPIIETPYELCDVLNIDYSELRYLVYHRDVVEVDHYIRYKIPKRRGGERLIAAPKRKLKRTQRAILDHILNQVPVTSSAHGFLKEKSVVTNADFHHEQPELVIKVDIEDFFPSITCERIRGMFHSLGYSGHISTLLAMLCSYCERMPIEVRGKNKYVATSPRILPQGSPASPMITNIICYKLDKRLEGLANTFNYRYTRYADDMTFTTLEEKKNEVGKFCGLIYQIIEDEDFKINNDKTRFLRQNNQQNITGVVINCDKLGVSRKWVRRFRAALHNAKQKDKIDVEKMRSLLGQAFWLNSVNASRYASYIDETIQLCIKQDFLSSNTKRKKQEEPSKKLKRSDKEENINKDQEDIFNLLNLRKDDTFIKPTHVTLKDKKYPVEAIEEYKQMGKIPIRNDQFTIAFEKWYNLKYKNKRLFDP